MEPDHISENGPEIAWHNGFGTQHDYSVPLGDSGCTSWNTNDGFGGC